MESQLRDWFCEQSARNPDFLKTRYLPAIEKSIETAHLALHEAERKCDLAEIKYRIGRLDGMQEILSLLNGLRMSQSNPTAPGLMARSLDYGRQLLKQASRQ